MTRLIMWPSSSSLGACQAMIWMDICRILEMHSVRQCVHMYVCVDSIYHLSPSIYLLSIDLADQSINPFAKPTYIVYSFDYSRIQAIAWISLTASHG